MCMCVHVPTCTHTHKHTHTYTYTHAHTKACGKISSFDLFQGTSLCCHIAFRFRHVIVVIYERILNNMHGGRPRITLIIINNIFPSVIHIVSTYMHCYWSEWQWTQSCKFQLYQINVMPQCCVSPCRLCTYRKRVLHRSWSHPQHASRGCQTISVHDFFFLLQIR